MFEFRILVQLSWSSLTKFTWQETLGLKIKPGMKLLGSVIFLCFNQSKSELFSLSTLLCFAVTSSFHFSTDLAFVKHPSLASWCFVIWTVCCYGLRIPSYWEEEFYLSLIRNLLKSFRLECFLCLYNVQVYFCQILISIFNIGQLMVLLSLD